MFNTQTKGKAGNGKIPITDDLIKLVFSHLAMSSDETVHKALVLNEDTPPVITIPSSMSKLDASKELKRQHEEEEMEININRQFKDWKWQDVLVAIKLTAESYFGWINAQDSFMSPPTEIEVIIDHVNGLPVKTTCFHGIFQVNALEEAQCGIGINGGIASVTFNIKKKYKKRVEEWYNLIDQHLRTKSIYKSKSVSVTTMGEMSFNDSVNFEIIETKANPMIVLNPKEQSVIQEYCSLDLEDKGKRTYLFTGPYGNGKTEAAMILGDKAKELGMTFFYCKDSKAFIELLRIAAKQYSPCLIFMEDIDEVGSGEERTAEINTLLNTLDGAETKNKDIKVLFTTNHHDSINPALRRPGRLDLIVKFENPEKAVVEQIFRKYFEGKPGSESLDYAIIAEKTPDCSGAFIAEICKRAVRLGTLNGKLTTEKTIAAIHTIGDHLKLMGDPVVKGDKLKDAMNVLANFFAQKVNPDAFSNDSETADEIKNAIYQTADALSNKIGGAALDLKKKIDIGSQMIGTVKSDTEKIIKNL